MSDIGQTNQCLITGRIAYGWDGTNARPIKVDSTGGVQVGTTYTTATHTSVTVLATTTVVLAANANRLYALIVNDSDEKIYVKIGANAVQSQGIPILPNGSYEMSKAMGDLNVGAINGICASGSKTMLVTEGV